MPNAVARAKRYEERATECRRLATLASSAESRIGYEQLADGYLKIAEAELGLAQEWPARDAKGLSAFVSDSAAKKSAGPSGATEQGGKYTLGSSGGLAPFLSAMRLQRGPQNEAATLLVFVRR